MRAGLCAALPRAHDPLLLLQAHGAVEGEDVGAPGERGFQTRADSSDFASPGEEGENVAFRLVDKPAQAVGEALFPSAGLGKRDDSGSARGTSCRGSAGQGRALRRGGSAQPAPSRWSRT